VKAPIYSNQPTVHF